MFAPFLVSLKSSAFVESLRIADLKLAFGTVAMRPSPFLKFGLAASTKHIDDVIVKNKGLNFFPVPSSGCAFETIL